MECCVTCEKARNAKGEMNIPKRHSSEEITNDSARPVTPVPLPPGGPACAPEHEANQPRAALPLRFPFPHSVLHYTTNLGDQEPPHRCCCCFSTIPFQARVALTWPLGAVLRDSGLG